MSFKAWAWPGGPGDLRAEGASHTRRFLRRAEYDGRGPLDCPASGLGGNNNPGTTGRPTAMCPGSTGLDSAARQHGWI